MKKTNYRQNRGSIKTGFSLLNIKLALLLFGIGSLVSLLCGCSPVTSSDQNGTTAPASGSYSSSNFSPAATTTPYNSNSQTPLAKLTQKPVSAAVGLAGQHQGPASIYPDPNLTPGDVFPGVTAAQVCVAGYSSSVRSVSAEEKAAVYQSYGIPNEPGKHEVDHFISLELGGSNNLKNLWPEPYEPRPGAHEKDTVENALHAEVCAGHISLAQAQRTIAADWYAYYLQIKHA